jgi:hypothetical protein
VKRREMLRVVGAASALSLIPREAEAIWTRLAAGHSPVNGLADPQLALVTALGDAIIPRTDTPGASDVGVPAWINLIVDHYYTSVERDPFIEGLAAIDAMSIREAGAPFAALPADARDRIMKSLDQPLDRNTVEARAYSRLKGLVIHGYFTSERVQREVLKTQLMFARFDGAAPHIVVPGRTP